MIRIKLNETTQEIKKGTRLLDLLDPSVQKNYYTCKVNGRLRELTYPLNKNAEIEFLGIENTESMKTYEATLRYMVAKAFHELYPNIIVRFNYNVSRSIFVKSETPNFIIDMNVSNNIKKYIQKLVEEDLPIERVTVDLDEAERIYKEFNLHDKLDILAYRPETTVHLYKCGNYYNYMHAYMAPSTGYIKKFEIRPYSPGLIIQYPRSEYKGEIPPFEESIVYGKTLKAASKWAHTINAETVDKINDRVTENTRDFIQICETKHNNMLAELSDMIAKDIENIRLILIAGPSSSGKTTFSNRLRIALMSRGITPYTISMDDYYIDRDKILPGPDGKLDLEDINTLDIELFNEHMYKLINGEEVDVPRFDFTIARRVKGHTVKVPENSPIIIEGIHALNEQMSSSIQKHQKFKIFISPQIQVNMDNHTPISTTDLRLLRRIVRDKEFRNASAEKTMDMWKSVRSGEFKWIYPHQEQSNYVYNSELSYELCVLKKYAMPLLKEISSESEFYITANRLIKYLKYFKEIDESAIPCNSLIREFIGGSCFNV